MDEMTNEQGITPVDLVEDDVTPAGESVPRRFAMQSIVGGFAGLAALAAATGAGAQEKKNNKKSTKKSASKQKAQAKKARSGQITRVRQITGGPKRFPAGSGYEIIRMRCPRPKNNERVYVMNGGYALSFAHATHATGFVVSFNAAENLTTWRVDAHNTGTGAVSLLGNAMCVYVRK